MLKNKFGFVPFQFNVIVTNEAPKFQNKLQFKKVALGDSTTYTLPNIIDKEK